MVIELNKISFFNNISLYRKWKNKIEFDAKESAVQSDDGDGAGKGRRNAHVSKIV